MSEIQHSQLDQYLSKADPAGLPSVCLIHGEEVLVEAAMQPLLSLFLDGADPGLCSEVIDGFDENLADALERINTFGLLAGPKIVIFKDAKLFETRGGPQNRVEKVCQAFDQGDLAKASKLFFSVCRQSGMEPQEIEQGLAGGTELAELKERVGSDGLNQLVRFGQEHGWSTTEQGDYRDTLHTAIAKGFPPMHRFVITTRAKVPKNLKLYKLIRETGLIIDCHVPLGTRRADQAAQQAVLQRALDKLLAGTGKRLVGGLFDKLCQLTGFDLRTFTQNLEKLIDYTGSRTEITAQDIDTVLRRTKTDPVYELTNAMADRNGSQALFYMNTLLKDKWHPLQILAAMTNQIRKLLIAKDFLQSEAGRTGISGMSYPQFQNQVMPIIETYDRRNQERIAQWAESEPSQGQKAAKSKKNAADLRLAPNPRNAYPVFQTLTKAEKFSKDALINAMLRLNQADLKLKSSGQDATVVIKSLLLEICRGH